ncbi:MAG: N-acetyltransferase [Planctomycetota bacterium]
MEPVRSRRHKQEFISLPFRLYKHDPCWVPPLISEMKERLDPKRHPFFTHGESRFFLARRNGRVVGRVAALIDRAHNAFHQERVVGFGFFDLEHDEEVAAALLHEVAAWGLSQEMTILKGPFNYSTNEECGTLIEGFDSSPVIMMTYNPPWHVEVLASLGLEKSRDILAYYGDKTVPVDRLKRIMDRTIQRYSLSIRSLEMDRFDAELDLIRAIYNSAWEKNWGFVPMGDKEFRWQALKLKQIVEPKLVMIVEAAGDPAGFSLSLPDFNQVLKRLNGRLFPFGIIRYLRFRNKIDGIRVTALGIRPEYRGIGAEGVLIYRTIVDALQLGFNWAELSWVLEDNLPMRKIAENLGARIYKRYRIWEAPLQRLTL